MCVLTYYRFNPSSFWCQKGCDIGVGRKSDPLLREQADSMCKMLATSNYQLAEGESLEDVEDVRIHATQYSINATNLYRACLAGVRRQKY